MAHNQRLGCVGIGVEATSGTAVTPTHWLQLSSAPSLSDKYEYQNVETARGRVEKSQTQKLMKTFGEGNLEVLLDDTFSVIPFGMILGSVVSATAGGSLYDHTITINNTNTAESATVVVDRVTDVRTFPYSVVEELSIKVSDSFATLSMALKSKESATGSATESYTTLNQFNFKELAVQFGATTASAATATATPLSGVDLTITRGVEPVFQTGANSPTKLVYKTLEVSGNYSLLFEATTDRDKYLANTANAMILTFTNGSNSVKITLPKVLISNWTPSNDLEDIVSQTADFQAHYDTSAGESIRAVIRNTTSSYLNLSA